MQRAAPSVEPMIIGSDTSAFAAYGVLALAGAALAYFVSDRFGRSHGVPPWRLPSTVWAVIALVVLPVLPIAVLVLPIACWTTARRTGPDGRGATSTAAGPADMIPRAPVTPQAHEPAQAGEPVLARDLPLFGWYPDPSGRHRERYWDGRVWTEHVRDGEVTTVDAPT